MISYHDYDPAHPFDVFGEKHIIRDCKITLDYVPLKGSVTIEGFTESTTGSPERGEFYIEYGDEDNYRTANSIVRFPEGYEGYMVTVDYKGVSTILRAKDLNEIKSFIEHGASELAARIIVLHEQSLMDEWRAIFSEHCDHVCRALEEIRDAVDRSGSGIASDDIAEDAEADEVLDEFFPGDDVPLTPKVTAIADDDEVEAILDEIFSAP